jgi:putative MFS transporter
MRASGSGWAAAFGRIAGIIAPYAVGVLLPLFGGPKAGQPTVFAIFMAFFAIIALDVLILGEETKGKRLEEIAG